jgi:hypothetical protein
MLDTGIVKPQGAVNSAAKNTAPLSFTPLRMSENASISLNPHKATRKLCAPSGPLDPLQSSLVPAQRKLLALAARANHGDARAWINKQIHCTIVDLKRTPVDARSQSREGKK